MSGFDPNILQQSADGLEEIGRMADEMMRDDEDVTRKGVQGDAVACTSKEDEDYKGGWRSSSYLREPLLPVFVAGKCLGTETPQALAVRNALMERDPTLVYFMRDAFKHGKCAACLGPIYFEVDLDGFVLVNVARQLIKVACSKACYSRLAADTASHPCLVFWFQTTLSPNSTASSSPDNTPSQESKTRAPRKLKAARGLTGNGLESVRRRLFPRDDA